MRRIGLVLGSVCAVMVACGSDLAASDMLEGAGDALADAGAAIADAGRLLGDAGTARAQVAEVDAGAVVQVVQVRAEPVMTEHACNITRTLVVVGGGMVYHYASFDVDYTHLRSVWLCSTLKADDCTGQTCTGATVPPPDCRLSTAHYFSGGQVYVPCQNASVTVRIVTD
jgi:hypothetical protein